MTIQKKVGLATLAASLFAGVGYKIWRYTSDAVSVTQQKNVQLATNGNSEVLPGSYESLLQEYKALAGQIEGFTTEVHSQQVDFLTDALKELVGSVNAPPTSFTNIVDTEVPTRFATLLNILEYQGWTALAINVLRDVDASNTKLLYLEERLRELNESALSIKASNVLRRAGFFSATDGSLVFVLESVKELVPKKAEVQIVEPDSCTDPALPAGLSSEFKAALCAQSQLLAAAQQTGDMTLRQWLTTAAGAVSHKGVSQSVDPYYYALLAQRYHRYQADLTEIGSQEDAALKNHDSKMFLKLFAEEQKIVLKSNDVVDSALYKGPDVSSDYISVFGSDQTKKPDVIGSPKTEPRASQITVINQTTRPVAAYIGGVFFSIDPGGSVARQVAGAGYPLLAWETSQVGRNAIWGRSFVSIEEGKEYTIGIRTSGSSEASSTGARASRSSASPGRAITPPQPVAPAGASSGAGEPAIPAQSGTDLAGSWTFTQASGVGNLTPEQRTRKLASGEIAILHGKEVYNQQGMVYGNQHVEFHAKPDGRFCVGQDADWLGNEGSRPCYARVGVGTYQRLGPFESINTIGCKIEMKGTDEFIQECTNKGQNPNFEFGTRAKHP